MKYLHIFSGIIYNVANKALSLLYQFRPFEETISRSLGMMTSDSLTEIKAFVKSQQDTSGAFKNKAGDPDIYYTLFGYFIARALTMDDTLTAIKKYTHQLMQSNLSTDIDYYCTLILTAHFFPMAKQMKDLKAKTYETISQTIQKKDNYGMFLGFIALVYSKQYLKLLHFLFKYQKRAQHNVQKKTLPVTAISSEMILLKTMRKKINDRINQLSQFYSLNGGFKALQKSPVEDLLSTSVALFALNYCKKDISIIKPSAMSFITGLYCNGGFKATVYDANPDIEYTFYGLLALSSLHKN